jgi:hypothetical protein
MQCTYLPLLGHRFIEWIIRVRCAQKRLYTEQNGADLKSWGPVVLEDIETDAPKAINVGVVDPSEESYSWWAHGVVIGQEKLQVKDSA